MTDEKAYEKKLKKMDDETLIAEWEKQEAKAIKTAGKSNWYIAERAQLIAGLELTRRGYGKKMIWVKA